MASRRPYRELTSHPTYPGFHQDYSEWFDDFLDDAAHSYTEADDGGTGAFTQTTDAVDGVATVATAAVDNDYHAIHSDSKVVQLLDGKKMWFEARFKLTEANTNESAWWFGVTDTLTTGGIQADTGGPLADYDGVLFWKDEASLAIDFEVSDATTQDTETNLATFESGTWTKVAFLHDGDGSLTPFVDTDGTGWVKCTSVSVPDIPDSTALYLIAGVKAGPTGGAETLHIDYLRVIQER